MRRLRFSRPLIISSDRADVGLIKSVIFSGVLGGLAAVFAVATWGTAPPGLLGLCLFGATSMAVYMLTMLRRRSLLASSRELWKVRDHAVIAEMPKECTVLILLLPYGIMSLGIPLWIAIAYAGGHVPWMAAGGFIYLGILGIGGIGETLWRGGPARPIISVDSKGLSLQHVDGLSTYVPWRLQPRFDHVHYDGIVITDKNGRQLVYRHGPALLLSYRQFKRLLETFSTSASHRRRLKDPDRALDCVLEVLEPTEEEYADRSWTWARPTPQT